MTQRPYRIAVAGTHSTGKSTFLEELRCEFERRGVGVAYVHDSALKAQQLGFPILADHTFESTAWLVARAIELETVATLTAEVILVDRPVPDALGYLLAALRHTNRSMDPSRLSRLEQICAAWSLEYHLVFLTVMDAHVPLGEGRDRDETFRQLAACEVTNVVNRYIPGRRLLYSGERQQAIAEAVAAYDRYRNGHHVNAE